MEILNRKQSMEPPFDNTSSLQAADINNIHN